MFSGTRQRTCTASFYRAKKPATTRTSDVPWALKRIDQAAVCDIRDKLDLRAQMSTIIVIVIHGMLPGNPEYSFCHVA